jgi:CubicO group peptidase (beta-lactamase class C family)
VARRNSLWLLAVPAAVLLAGAGVVALTADRKPATLRELVERTRRRNSIPSLGVIVVRDGKPILAEGFGEVGPDTRFRIGSLTKSFTAILVMGLVERGEWRLEDPVSRYVPDLPEAWRKITLEQLLRHTSGIPSYTSERIANFARPVEPEQVLDLVAERDLEFAPGRGWAYSNTGYFLLGMALEAKTGKSYRTLVRERISRPLGLKNTDVADAEPGVDRASGFAGTGLFGSRSAKPIDMSWPFAAGALETSPRDLLAFERAIGGPKLLRESTWKRMFAPTRLPNGETRPYGLGWMIRRRHDRTFVAHNGGIPGFRAYLTRSVDGRTAVGVMANRDGAPCERIARDILDFVDP